MPAASVGQGGLSEKDFTQYRQLSEEVDHNLSSLSLKQYIREPVETVFILTMVNYLGVTEGLQENILIAKEFKHLGMLWAFSLGCRNITQSMEKIPPLKTP